MSQGAMVRQSSCGQSLSCFAVYSTPVGQSIRSGARSQTCPSVKHKQILLAPGCSKFSFLLGIHVWVM